MIEFFVPGTPRPAGSKRGFAIKKGGNYTGKTIVVDTSGQKGTDWRGDVKRFVMEGWRGRSLLDEGIELYLEFVMPRPKSHYRSNGKLKPNAPSIHTKKPDVLKLARAVEDALTGIVWTDDSKIFKETLQKRYVNYDISMNEHTGVTIGVRVEGRTLLRDPLA